MPELEAGTVTCTASSTMCGPRGARGFGFRPSERVDVRQLAALFARVERTISPASLSSLFRADAVISVFQLKAS